MKAHEPRHTPKIYRHPVFVLATGILLGAFIVFCDYYAVAPNGAVWLLKVQSLSPIALLVGFVQVVIGATQYCGVKTRRKGAIRFAVWLLLLLIVIVAVRLGHKIRMNAFLSLSERSAPLVNAIRAYQADHGIAPERLESLVPEYLPRIPRTGMGAYPHYDYRRVQAPSENDNPWFIQIFVPTGNLNFDEFFYYPLQNYPPFRNANSVERVGDWAYLHDKGMPAALLRNGQ